MSSVFPDKARDISSVAIGPIRKVKGNEHLEIELLGRCICIIQLLWRIAIHPRRSTVQSETINTNSLGLLDLVYPVLNSEILDDSNLCITASTCMSLNEREGVVP